MRQYYRVNLRYPHKPSIIFYGIFKTRVEAESYAKENSYMLAEIITLFK